MASKHACLEYPELGVFLFCTKIRPDQLGYLYVLQIKNIMFTLLTDQEWAAYENTHVLQMTCDNFFLDIRGQNYTIVSKSKPFSSVGSSLTVGVSLTFTPNLYYVDSILVYMILPENQKLCSLVTTTLNSL